MTRAYKDGRQKSIKCMGEDPTHGSGPSSVLLFSKCPQLAANLKNLSYWKNNINYKLSSSISFSLLITKFKKIIKFHIMIKTIITHQLGYLTTFDIYFFTSFSVIFFHFIIRKRRWNLERKGDAKVTHIRHKREESGLWLSKPQCKAYEWWMQTNLYKDVR